MKRLLIVLLVVLFAIPAFAELDGQTFETAFDGQVFELTFQKTPFSGGECGQVLLTDSNNMEVWLNYTYDSGCGDIEGLPFLYKDGEIRLFFSDPLVFAKQ